MWNFRTSLGDSSDGLRLIFLVWDEMLAGMADMAEQRIERVFGHPERPDQSKNKRFPIKVWGNTETLAVSRAAQISISISLEQYWFSGQE